jgi:DHA3 family tetracycline resistance protein-like MFS transporter
MTVSLLGDGMYYVAIAWQVLELDNRPTAMSFVGVAWVTPQILLMVFGGVLTDRIERRRMMMAADVIRAAAIGTMGVLSVSGALELWHVVALVVVFGVGDAVFWPAFTAIVPELVPADELVQANSLDNFVRPATRLVGPALGGLVVATVGPGTAFLVNAGSFVVSFAALALVSPRPSEKPEHGRSALRDIREGFAFVRGQTWLWGTLVLAAFGNFATSSMFVLVPYVVKTELGGTASEFGLIAAFGAVGGLLGSLVLGQLGLPRRHIVLMFLSWAVGVLCISGYGIASSVPPMWAFSAISGAAMSVGSVVWGTLMHSLVPKGLLGRVSAVDWTLSIALTPVAYAVLGPIGEAFGASRTLIVCGAVGSVLHIAFLALPGIRGPEGDERVVTAARARAAA